MHGKEAYTGVAEMCQKKSNRSCTCASLGYSDLLGTLTSRKVETVLGTLMALLERLFENTVSTYIFLKFQPVSSICDELSRDISGHL